MTETTNHQILLARRPKGIPRPDDFRVVDRPMLKTRPGEILLQNLNLSLDPYMRGRMNGSEDSYAPPYALEAPPGGGTVARVIESRRNDSLRAT